MRLAVILNPAAQNGRARRIQDRLRAEFERIGLDASHYLTGGPGHATRLAQRLADDADAVVAVGGDGTIQEVAAGLVAHSGGVPLGVVPLGTGNDFAKMLKLPRGLAAVCALASARAAPVDYGEVRWDEGAGERSGIFINALGLGFDARVAHEVARFKAIPGFGAYLAGVFAVLRSWKAPYGTVEVDGVPWFDGRLLLLTAANGKSTGGSFYLTPAASVQDGKLDVCRIEEVSVRRLLTLLPLALRGKHVGAHEVCIAHARTVRAEVPEGVFLHADGEVLARAARHVEVRVVPGGLNVLM